MTSRVVPEPPPEMWIPGWPSRQTHVEHLLTHGPVLLHVDATQAGVVVPAEHATNHELSLRIGRALVPPIPDLALDDGQLTATLAFAGVPFKVVVPWAAVYGANLEGAPEGVSWRAELPVARVRQR